MIDGACSLGFFFFLREGVVRFEEISGSIMENVLEFIYTGTVEVTSENAKELIAAGNYLIMPNLKKISGRFLEREMTTSNCISTFYFAEKYDCGELIDNSQKFIRSNFSSVATMHEFCNALKALKGIRLYTGSALN